jgi:protoheme IX farnesyltransferase
MVYDRDIDILMTRTCNRPLPSGRVSVKEATLLGAGMSLLGIGWALALDPLYSMIVFVGWAFDVVVYTAWLKRRTPWSIVLGGIAGGMPILAGRVLGFGSIDWVGIFLALSVLLWIPTHIMTFSLKYKDDFARAGIPTFPSVYGDRTTRLLIAGSSVASALSMAIAMVGVGTSWGYVRLLVVLSIGLLLLAINSLLRPSLKTNYSLFKYASVFMLGSMMLVVIGVLV